MSARDLIRLIALSALIGRRWDDAFAADDLDESERQLVRLRAISAALASGVTRAA